MKPERKALLQKALDLIKEAKGIIYDGGDSLHSQAVNGREHFTPNDDEYDILDNISDSLNCADDALGSAIDHINEVFGADGEDDEPESDDEDLDDEDDEDDDDQEVSLDDDEYNN